MRFDRKIWAVAASLAVLSLGVFLREQLPSANDRIFAAFEYGDQAPQIGKIENVNTRIAETVNGMSSLAGWVIVDFSYTPDELGQLTGEIQAEDGTLFASTNSMAFSCGTRYTGLRTECTLVFEMPPEKLEAAKLLVYRGTTQMAPQMTIDLGEPTRVPDAAVEGL